MSATRQDMKPNSILDTNSLYVQQKAPVPKGRFPWKQVLIGLAIVVILVAVFVTVGILSQRKYKAEQAKIAAREQKEDMTYFESETDKPEMSETEITSLITKAYYTNDGSLATKICFGNGMASSQAIVGVEVTLRNENGATVAQGYSDALPDSFIVTKGDTEELLLYLLPEYVQVPDDDLDTIDYDVSVTYQPVAD